MLLLTLRGTPTCYYGDEIGMKDVPVPPGKIQDPQGLNDPAFNRDPQRSPMQWTSGPNAGFAPAPVEPWLPLAHDHGTVNVERQSEDPSSMLSFFRRLVALRRERPALISGSYEEIETGERSVLAFVREGEDDRVVVVLNFGPEPVTPCLPHDLLGDAPRLLLSTHPERKGPVSTNELDLGPHEGLLLRPS